MSSLAYTQLKEFITKRMRMSHIYQPVMLQVMLKHGGRASREEIAKVILAHDRSQIDYYQDIVRNMPGRVLGSHGIVEREGAEYRFTKAYQALNRQEQDTLIALCEARLEEYLEKRGLAPWQHRKKAAGYVPGSLRYDIIRRAKGRCEACGVSADERALEVDHIVPRNKDGTDDPSNLQALCYKCNAEKRDRDDTDFAAVKASYADRDEGCVICDPPAERVIDSNELALTIADAFPVTEGHTLVISKRHVSDYFNLYSPERNAIEDLLHKRRNALLEADDRITGFNVGINAGFSAGQTISHAHVHLIPRRGGDTDDPRGGVRGVIPDKQKY